MRRRLPPSDCRPACPPIGTGLHALTGTQAKQTLIARFGPRVDQLRQRLTDFGLRPYTVALVWTKWTGPERGDGRESLVLRHLILPNPKVEDLSGVSFQFYAAGTLPVGSVRVTGLPARYSSDELLGLCVPSDKQAELEAFIATGQRPEDPAAVAVRTNEVPEPFSFHWEITEDGRNGVARPQRYRLLAQPFRRPGSFDWTCLLERTSEDPKRDGLPRTARRALPAFDDDD